ncbi:MAG: proline dehydrogenase family protein [Propionicimonas sp.]|nr:proline dehydrogenase family protein [Propionicimonas sp.]
MLRTVLLQAARSDRLRKVVSAAPFTRTVVARFIAGDTIAAGLEAAKALAVQGIQATIDVLGEDTTDPAQAERATASYLELLAGIPDAGLVGSADVSLKLTSLGSGLPGGAELAYRNARRICEAAQAVGATVTIDAEDHTTLDRMHAIVEQLRVDFPGVGLVLQTMLHRTAADAVQFSGPGSRVRLCKGAYDEPSGVALQRREEVSAAYVATARALFKGQGYPMLATHDPEMIEAAQVLAAENGRRPGDYEFQMLYGIRTDEQRRLARAGHRVRVYVPCGTEWWGYFVRRLAERPANLLFFLRALVGR